jgi:tripartite-type tricarboxylate transporter receptor subunit TctC
METKVKNQLKVILAIGASLTLGLLGIYAQAQSTAAFPTQGVRLISPFPAGSGPDVVARIVGEKLGASWKQSVIIDNKPGANGFLAIGAAKQAAPNGYDLLLADVGHLAISPSLFKKLPYDPKGDFVPVSGVYHTSFYVVVGANSPLRSVRDLIDAAAAAPGKITYGSNSVGGPLHLGGAQVEAVSNTKMLHVPYKEISQLYAAVSTGEVDWAMGSLASAGPLLRAGKVRLLAIADSTRSTALPEVPTFQEAGGPNGVVVRSWVALLAPKATPTDVVSTLNRSINEVLKLAEVREKLAAFGFVPDVQTAASLTSLIDSETVFYANMVKRTGASAE